MVSGPNYGRNSTAVFSLSSGTLGGALEAAICRRKAIALSYAFFSRNHDPEIIAGASRLSIRVIEYLYKNWAEGVDLYSVNVPLVEEVDTKKILWTNLLQNYWGPGSCFQEVEDEDENAEEGEERIRETEGVLQGDSSNTGNFTKHTHKHFKWAPRFSDVYKSVEEAGPGNDGWAVKEGFTRYYIPMMNSGYANFFPQCHTFKGKFYACICGNGRGVEVVSSITHSVGAFRPFRSNANFVFHFCMFTSDD